jgi:DNA primase
VIKIEQIKAKPGGNELAKVLWYYNLIPDVSALTQKIVCPFHEDINPSMIVNFEDGSWFCFGCNSSGDAIKFVKLMEAQYNKLNDLQAYKKYLQILKSKKCSGIKLDRALVKQKPHQKDLYNEAYDYYHGLKKVNWEDSGTFGDNEESEAKTYMMDRGFSPDTLNKCKAKVTYNRSYGIIFPMLDNGKFKGWVCRTMLKAVEAKRKYLYNKGFSRANTLVGNYGKHNYVIVVEGYMDRLKFVQFGEDNVVAILGWKMSQQQIQKLKAAGIKNVISALDNDTCGKQGAEFLKQHFNVTRFAYLKGVKDPGDMTQELFNKMFRRTMLKYNKNQEK